MAEGTSDAKSTAKQHRLFRAIVVLGTALTAGPGCDDEDCCKPQPIDSSVAQTDGPVTDGGVADTPVDVVLII
jgi:hypothetical protein